MVIGTNMETAPVTVKVMVTIMITAITATEISYWSLEMQLPVLL